jgi:hypothetical protein
MPKYSPGDRILFDVELEDDESEIAQVKIVFCLQSNKSKEIEFVYGGDPFPSGHITLGYDVYGKVVPGLYELKEFYAVDTKDNRNDFSPSGLEFQIENESVDTEGPRLINVKFG